MPLSRRQIIQLAGLFGLAPLQVVAAWSRNPKPGFDTRDTIEALYLALGNAATVASDAIEIQLPEVADLGAVVPVRVSTSLPGVESISLLAPVNHTPLIATYRFAAQTEAFIETRIKLAKTTRVMTVVKSEGRLLSNTRGIEVNKVGCRV